jgi:methylmalonyl-CoA/ethylmalonyl-CoA epimerase
VTIVFDHVAIATRRIADAPEFLVAELGGSSGFGGPSGEFSWWHWDFPEGGRIEILEPLGPPGGFVERFLERTGPGIHHVTFKVPSLRQACDRATELGYGIVGYNDSHPGWQEAFLHPKQAMGIVVQLTQSDASEDDDHDHSHFSSNPPPEPDSPPPPATVVGVRLRTADRARAVQQWSQILRADLDEAPGELLFTWPGSGMRIAVSLDAASPDRSEAIELRSDRALRLPEGPHPVLGAQFRQLS